MRRQAQAGGTKIRVLITAVLLVSFVAYQLLIPIMIHHWMGLITQ